MVLLSLREVNYMSFYDELSKIYQVEQQRALQNPLLQFSQSVDRMGPAPIQQGGGFLQNFAASAVPQLTSALAGYLGQQQAEQKQQKLAAMLSGMPTDDIGQAVEYFKGQGRMDLALPAMAAAQEQRMAEKEREADLSGKLQLLNYEYGKKSGIEQMKIGARNAQKASEKAAELSQQNALLEKLGLFGGGGMGSASGQPPVDLTPAEKLAIAVAPDDAGKFLAAAGGRQFQAQAQEKKEVRKRIEELSARADKWDTILPNIARAGQIAPQAYSTGQGIGNFIQRNFASVLDPSEVARREELQALSGEIVDKFREKGSGSFTESDAAQKIKALPSIENSAEVNQKNFERLYTKGRLEQEKLRRLADALSSGSTETEFNKFWKSEQPKIEGSIKREITEVLGSKGKSDVQKVSVAGRQFSIGDKVVINGQEVIVTEKGFKPL